MTPGTLVEPFDGLRLVGDDDEDRPDAVQGVTAAARTLAGLLVPRRVERALDLGTGSGLLALVMARHARRVVATDVNPRALAFARRSARLSGVRTIEWRRGDWYAPVRGERFDLVACNPPYVISPEDRLVFRDGSAATPGVVRGVADHLVPGGLAELLVNFSHPLDDWVAGLRDWIPAGCDALVVHHASMRPLQYAETWVGGDRDRVAHWLGWYREQGIRAIGAAFLLLRRRADDGPPRLQALEATSPSTPGAGVHVERILAGTDLAARGEDALLAARLALAAGTRVDAANGTLSCVPTVGVRATVPPELLPLVRALDGARPLRAVLGDLPGEQRAAALAQVRRLAELGLAAQAA